MDPIAPPWNTGMMERWNNGMLGRPGDMAEPGSFVVLFIQPILPLFQYSVIPGAEQKAKQGNSNPIGQVGKNPTSLG